MNDLTMEKAEIGKCLLCYDPPCAKVCPALDPARLLRSVRFQNETGAAMSLPEADACAGCAAPCVQACPVSVSVPRLLACLRADSAYMEQAPGAQTVDLSCDLCGIPLENPFLLSSSVVASGYEMCARAFDMGWAGIAYKTICTMEIHETSPRFSALKDGSGAFYGFKNIEQLEYISSAGLRAVLKAQKVMNTRGGMKLIHVNDTIMEVFDITGFVDILTIA